MSELVYTVEDKDRISEQVSVLWERDMWEYGYRLIAIRFDQTPRGVDDEGNEYPGIAFVYVGAGDFYIAWGACSYGDDRVLQFTEDDWESWSESGQEPWTGDQYEYKALMKDIYPEHPEWEHRYM